MARILGLDLGSHSVKAVLIETTLRGFTREVASWPCPLPPEGDRGRLELAAALEALSSSLPLWADTVVVALPGVALATHPITLPFNDPKKIESTLAFEVEEPAAVRSRRRRSSTTRSLTPTTPGPSCSSGVVKKNELARLLEVLKDAKLDPRIVTHPGLVYQNLLANCRLPICQDAAVAIVDLGHERVSVAIGRPGGAVELARTFAGGGQALTKALSAEFKISLADAAAWKETHGAVGTEVVGPDAERAAGAFLRALQPVLRELRPTLKSYTAQGAPADWAGCSSAVARRKLPWPGRASWSKTSASPPGSSSCPRRSKR